MAVYGLGLSICQTARRLSPIDRAGDRATSSPTPELSNARFRAYAGVMAQLGHQFEPAKNDQPNKANIALADVQPAIMARRGEWPRAMAVIHHLQV
jgi:hypothetical protein